LGESARHDVERAKWDAHAHTTSAKLDDLELIPEGTTLETYAREKLSMSGMAEFLGDLSGRRVLEYGCGLGELTIVLARSGAEVTSFDLSQASVDFARTRAERNGVADRIQFVVADGEALPFADDSFDIAVGKAVLHHLEPAAGAAELARVLAPGGKAAFSEPLGMNPILVFARAHLPYPGKHERGADRPLTANDLRLWGEPFGRARMRPIQFLSMVERGLGFGHPLPILRRIDRSLIDRFPRLSRLYRYAVLYFEAPLAVEPAQAKKSRSRAPAQA
jgi:SAM-dependent methyltransferase